MLYLVSAGSTYYPNEGSGDFDSVWPTLPQARARAEQLRAMPWNSSRQWIMVTTLSLDAPHFTTEVF